MRGFFVGLLQCVLASPRRGDKLMLNYDSEQKGKKLRRRIGGGGEKNVKEKKRKTDLPLVTRTKSKKT